MVGFNIFAPPPVKDRNCKVWRENWRSVLFFSNFCQTQWRYVGGMGGVMATGLDHTAVLADLRTLRLQQEDFDGLYADVRLMEHEALKVMSKK